MDELTRFAQVLVERLSARPEGVHRPIAVGVVRNELVPYRAERTVLGLSSVEDYEAVLLRLVSEERGFVRTTPSAAAERCREVLAHPNPDLGVLEEIAESMIQVTSLAAGQTGFAESPSPGSSPSPPPPPPPPPPPVTQVDSVSAQPNQTGACRHCGKDLPLGRAAVFCPWCGNRQVPLTCGRCGAEFESGWRHCISCGGPVSDPTASR